MEEKYGWMASNGGEWSDFHSREKEVNALAVNLAHWHQGDLVADVPMTWVVPKQDPVTGLSSGSAGAGFHRVSGVTIDDQS